jgi:DNA-directed RNA polymerase subunit M/transcription elongation factor TFIIS
MKMKYCPECGSIQLQNSMEGLKCKKCNYIGEMNEDSIDVINSFLESKKIQAASSFKHSSYNRMQISSENCIEKRKEIQFTYNPKPNESILPRKLSWHSEKSSYAVDSLQPNTRKPEEIPLKERLKKLQGKDTEIL